MHIMEGFLPVEHAIGWSAASLPFLAWGVVSIKKQIADAPERRMLLGVGAAFAFVLSALKLPSVTGSCSHPTGTGLGALLFGPAAMAPTMPARASSMRERASATEALSRWAAARNRASTRSSKRSHQRLRLAGSPPWARGTSGCGACQRGAAGTAGSP